LFIFLEILYFWVEQAARLLFFLCMGEPSRPYLPKGKYVRIAFQIVKNIFNIKNKYASNILKKSFSRVEQAARLLFFFLLWASPSIPTILYKSIYFFV
jgi:hypothetical protein